MDVKLLGRRLVPHLLILAAFAAIVCLYFSPLVFQGLSLKQGDAAQWAGSAQEIAQFRDKTGTEALWTNAMFSGMPAYTISVIYSGELLEYVERIMRVGIPYPASILFISLLCYYVLMLVVGYRPLVAAMAAIGFTFFTFTFISIEAGHNSKVRAMALAPLVVAGIVAMFQDRRWLGLALTSLGMGMQIRAGHYQITYYLVFFVILLGLYQLIRAIKGGQAGRFALHVGLLVLAVGLGVATNAARLWQVIEYTPLSMRGPSELTTAALPGGANDDEAKALQGPAGEAGDPAPNAAPQDGGLARDYVFSWSNQKMETFTLLVPHFYGGSSNEVPPRRGALATSLKRMGYSDRDMPELPLYRGDQPFTSGPVYAGAVIVFLAVAAVILVGWAQTWWLVAAILLSLVLTWGRHLESINYLLYDVFPGYNRFRAVTMAIYIAQLSLPWLAALGLTALLEPRRAHVLDAHTGDIAADEVPGGAKDPVLPPVAPAGTALGTKPSANGWFAQDKTMRALQYAAGGLGVLLILFWMAPSLGGDMASPNDAQLPQDFRQALYNELLDDRAAMLSADALRSVALIVLTGAVLLAGIRGKAKAHIIAGIVAAIVLGDLWSVNQRYLNRRSFDRNFYTQRFTPTGADARMQQLPYSSYRVLNLRGTFQESRTSYYHQSLGGYSPAKLRRYQDLIVGPGGADGLLAREIAALPAALQSGDLAAAFEATPIINMLNGRFVTYGDEASQVIDNPRACGNAWFVPAVRQVSGADEEYRSLAAPGFDPRFYALVDGSKFTLKPGPYRTDNARVTLTDYQPNQLTYQTNNPQDGLLVMSENYYPLGWEATLDGQPIPMVRVNYTLRAIEVPAGQHTIICRFTPDSYRIGNQVSLWASVGVLLLFGLAAWQSGRRVGRGPTGTDQDPLRDEPRIHQPASRAGA